MYAAHWRWLVHGKVLDFRGTEYYVLIWLLTGRDELCWGPMLTKKIVSVDSHHEALETQGKEDPIVSFR
jgi:hypothetical protein